MAGYISVPAIDVTDHNIPFCPDSAIDPCRFEESRIPPMLAIELAVDPRLRGYLWGGTRGDSS